jgi:magnesium-transporting ATPase (P-type)
LVIYTGKNTKIMMNSDSESIKMSQVEVKVNSILGIVFIAQLVLCVITAVGFGIFRNQNIDAYTYIDWNRTNNTAVDSLIIFFTYFVLLNTMIPISLIVSIEMVKLFQKYFIDNDKFMYS